MHIVCILQPWESQSFCSTFPYEIVCADSWGQSLLVATDTAGVVLLEGEIPPKIVFFTYILLEPALLHMRSFLPISGPDPALTSAGESRFFSPKNELHIS